MKEFVEKVLEQIRQKAQQIEDNKAEAVRLKEENATLASEIREHQGDLMVFAKYLEEEERKTLKLDKQSKAGKGKKPTFPDIILSAVKKQPQTVEALHETFKVQSGNGDIAFGTFNNKLRLLVKNGKVKKHEPEGAESGKQHLVGLPSMFEGEVLKEKFLR